MRAKQIILWILSLTCAGMITFFSAQTRAQSASLSGSIAGQMLEFFPAYQEMVPEKQEAVRITFESVLRALAHVAEFAALGLTVSLLTATYRRRWFTIAYPVCLLYAFGDELLQLLLAAGRAFEFVDLIKDWVGSLAGTGVAALGLLICSRREQKRNHPAA